MIIKAFELEKKITKNKIYLFYGKNDGHKEEIIKSKFLKEYPENTYKYSEKEIFENLDNFYNTIQSHSFFEKEKLIIISDVTDKIKKEIEEILNKKIDNITIILISNILDKKSKLRSFFEKDKNLICIPFYGDNNLTLTSLTKSFFREKKIPISQEIINLIVDRSNEDRKNLKNELFKIESYIINQKKIKIDDIIKLTNLSENHSITNLVDNCLAKNKKKTSYILNENNYTNEDSIIIIRTFLVKAKRLLKLTAESKKNKNLDTVISSFKPPIFWKEKEIIKSQLKNWTTDTVEKLIYEINQVELLIKKNSQSSLNILSDFILRNTKINS